MQDLLANVDHIKFDLEIAVQQQLGAQPLPFPGMDSKCRDARSSRSAGAGTGPLTCSTNVQVAMVITEPLNMMVCICLHRVRICCVRVLHESGMCQR